MIPPQVMYLCTLRPALYVLMVFMFMTGIFQVAERISRTNSIDFLAFLQAFFPVIMFRVLDMFAYNMTVAALGKEKVERIQERFCKPPSRLL